MVLLIKYLKDNSNNKECLNVNNFLIG